MIVNDMDGVFEHEKILAVNLEALERCNLHDIIKFWCLGLKNNEKKI